MSASRRRSSASSGSSGASDERRLEAVSEVTYEGVFGIEDPRRATDRLQDVLWRNHICAAPTASPAGLPGIARALPVINREAVRHVVAIGAQRARVHALGRQDDSSGPAQGLPDLASASCREPSHGRLAVERSHGVETVASPAPTSRTVESQHTRDGARAISLLDYNRPRTSSPTRSRRDSQALRGGAAPSAGDHRCFRDAAMDRCESRPRTSRCAPWNPAVRDARRGQEDCNSFSFLPAIQFEGRSADSARIAGRGATMTRHAPDEDRGLRPHAYETSDDYRYFPYFAPLCRRCASSIRPGSTRFPGHGRPRHDERAIATIWPCRPTMPRVLVSDAAATAVFEAARAADPGLPPKNWPIGPSASTCVWPRMMRPSTSIASAVTSSRDLVRRVQDDQDLGHQRQGRRRCASPRPVERRPTSWPRLATHRSATVARSRQRRRGHRRRRCGRRCASWHPEGHRLPDRAGHEEDARPGPAGVRNQPAAVDARGQVGR